MGDHRPDRFTRSSTLARCPYVAVLISAPLLVDAQSKSTYPVLEMDDKIRECLSGSRRVHLDSKPYDQPDRGVSMGETTRLTLPGQSRQRRRHSTGASVGTSSLRGFCNSSTLSSLYSSRSAAIWSNIH